ncbi:MAG: DUF87 domain-containing protein [Candidatus Micrarchaeota archaeon]|nr:DUF87 domain-containing protein [Candidatus Micrarchaeota archaeon]
MICMIQFYEIDKYIVFSKDLPRQVLPKQLSPDVTEVFFNSSKNGVFIGRSEHQNVPIFWNSRLYPNGHCCVLGMSGSGKTYFVKTFITRAYFSGAKAIIFDWTGEYVPWVTDIKGKVLEMSIFSFDIFPEPEEIHENLSNTVFILSVLAELDNDETVALHELIYQYYMEKMKKPDLNEFIKICKSDKRINAKMSYHFEDLKRLFKNVGNIEEYLKSEKILCLDFSMIEKEKQRILFSHIVLNLVYQKMRFNNTIETFIVIDEAWRLLRKKTLENLIREGRKYLHNLVLASQNLADFGDIVFSNFSSFFIFKLQSHSERMLIAKSLLIDEETIEKIGNLPRGKCFCNISLVGKNAISFFVKRVEGEDGIIWYTIKYGDAMEMQIERELLIRRLKENGIKDNDINDILNYLDLHNRNVSIMEVARKLVQKGYSLAQIISLLRSIQIYDEVIVNVLAELEEKEDNMNKVDIELSD